MAVISLTLPEGEYPVTGKQITFEAPCSSEEATSISIDGTIYELVDAIGNVIPSTAFLQGAMVSIILNNNSLKAFIQNPITTKFVSDSLATLEETQKEHNSELIKHGLQLDGHSDRMDRMVTAYSKRFEDTERDYTNKINEAESKFDIQTDELQEQINNLVLYNSESGDITPEVIQARVSPDGTNYPTLKGRLDNEHKYPYGSFNIEWTDGYLVNGVTGAEIESSGLSVSNYIDVSQHAGSTVEIFCRFASTAGYAFYDSEKKFISGANKNSESVSVGNYKNRIVVPEIAKYMRITGMTNSLSNYYVKPTPLVSEILGTSKNILPHKIAMFGDSITLGRDGNGEYTDIVKYTIPRIVGAMLSVECVNYGVGGMGWLPNESLETMAYDKISSVDLTQYDMITLCYGTNDHRNTLGTWDSTDETTCLGQFHKCINYIYEQNPTARVIVIGPWNGINVGEFPDYWYGTGWGRLAIELEKACEHYHIPFISQETSPLNGILIQSIMGADGTHPSVDGYKLIGEWLATKIQSLSSGITYKQVTKEIESNMVSVLRDCGAINLIPELNVDGYDKSGITMSADKGTYTISGTASAVWYYNIAGSETSYPKNFIPGETYHINFEPTHNRIYLRIYQFDEANPDGVSILLINKSTTFTVPENANGLIVRLHIANGATVDGVVKPVITKSMTNAQLEERANNTDLAVSEIKNVLVESGALNLLPELDVAENVKSGITMSAENGMYTVSGTSSAVWFYNIAGSTTSYPEYFVEGETYRITFEPTDRWIYLRIIQFTDENPSGVDVVLTNQSTTFTVPTGANGLIVRLHLANGRTVDGSVKPFISKKLTDDIEEKETPPAMLTIIDDDGHIGFMNDLLPIIESRHVSIATAITQMRIGTESKWMTWEQILDCYSRGAEVLCHTYDHDPNTPDKDIKQIEWEYTVARNNMYMHGLNGADILVYNNITGKSEKCQEAASKVFKCAVHSSGRVINQVGAINPYYIQRIPVELDPYYYDVEQLKALIDQNIAQGGWMVWIIHTSATSWSTYNGANAIATAIDYAIERGLPIVSTNYGYKKYIARTD